MREHLAQAILDVKDKLGSASAATTSATASYASFAAIRTAIRRRSAWSKSRTISVGLKPRASSTVCITFCTERSRHCGASGRSSSRSKVWWTASRKGQIEEVILATNPTVEGEATAVYLSRLLKPLGPARHSHCHGHPGGQRSGIRRRSDHVPLARKPPRYVATVATTGNKVLVTISSQPPRPKWLRAPAPVGENYRELKELVTRLGLHTVCESAACPNVGECWNRRTATFMILGNVCTRRCGFCAVQKGAPLAVDFDEPRRVAEAVRRSGPALRRDHQRQPRRPQGRRRRAVRADHPSHSRAHPGCKVEVLVPDFQGSHAAMEIVMRHRARRTESQYRDRPAALSPGPSRRALRTLARHAAIRQTNPAANARPSPGSCSGSAKRKKK